MNDKLFRWQRGDKLQYMSMSEGIEFNVRALSASSASQKPAKKNKQNYLFQSLQIL